MNWAAANVWLVILLGILRTTQTHLAKALERQGIEALDLVRAKLRRAGERVTGSRGKPLVYVVGLILNHTTFVYHLFVAPLGGTAALYTSMYGVGLVSLLVYSKRVLKERVTRPELTGALAIVFGTLIIGVEGVSRPPADMGRINLTGTTIAVGVLLGGGMLGVVAALRDGSPNVTGLAFGLVAGACGALDPFLKGVGQTAGGGGRLTPGSAAGWIVLASSFVIGEVAVLVTQWGFYRRARANILVPAYNCSYVTVPVILQVLLLPGYALYWTTGAGLALIVAGFVLMRGLRPGRRAAASLPASGPAESGAKTA